jgi:hypothetical protein
VVLKGELPVWVLQICDDTGTASTTAVVTTVTYAASVSTTTNITAIYTTTVAATAGHSSRAF